MSTAHWLLVPPVATGATLVGAFLIYYGSTEIADAVPLGERGLGVGVWLLVGGALAVAISLVAGLLVGLARSDAITTAGAAIRQALLVAATITATYLVAATLIWLLAQTGS